MPLNIHQYEELATVLREVPSLVDELEARHTSFFDDVLAWLRRAEEIMENNRMPAVSQLASWRARMIDAARGAHGTDLEFVGRPTSRKIRDATASRALQQGSSFLHDLTGERQAVFAEAERISGQLVAAADAKGALRACDDGRPHQQFLECLQARIAADPDLAAVGAHLVGLVGRTDALVFLDRAVARVS
jgi:hypothetical protein